MALRRGIAPQRVGEGGCFVFARHESSIRSAFRPSTRFHFKTWISKRVHHRFDLFAAATESSETEQKTSATEPKEWIALIANAEFMLHDVQNESLAEQLREKVRFYGEKEKEIDFYLVPEPVWLDARYPDRAKRVRRPCIALVSTDPIWMRFMKTRLDQVLEIRLENVPREEVLKAGGEIPDFEKPEIWRAPYAPYSPGWWKAFYPKETQEEVSEEDQSG